MVLENVCPLAVVEQLSMLEEERGVKESQLQFHVKVIIVRRFSLTKEQRLRKKAEFTQVRTNGLRLYSRSLILYVLKNNFDFCRSGFIVSKKVSKKAVVRNRIRRRLKNIFRLNQHNFSDSYDLVVIAKKNCLDEDYYGLEKNFIKALNEKNYLSLN